MRIARTSGGVYPATAMPATNVLQASSVLHPVSITAIPESSSRR